MEFIIGFFWGGGGFWLLKREEGMARETFSREIETPDLFQGQREQNVCS